MTKAEMIERINSAARELFDAIEDLELEYDLDAEFLIDVIDNSIEDFLETAKKAK